jgi:hypothetical protein
MLEIYAPTQFNLLYECCKMAFSVGWLRTTLQKLYYSHKAKKVVVDEQYKCSQILFFLLHKS